jgi:hypothetical protein
VGWWQELPRLAKAGLVLIGGVGTIVATMSFVQDFINYKSSDSAQATAIAISDRQLEVLKEIATAQAGAAQAGPTATAIAERVALLVSTQEALETQKHQVMATLTAIMPRPASTLEVVRKTETVTPTFSTAPTTAETPTPSSRTWLHWKRLSSFPAPGDRPTGIVRVEDQIWVSVPCDEEIYRMNLKGEILSEVTMPKPGCGPQVVGIAWDGKALWGGWWNTVLRVDLNTGQILSQFNADDDVDSMAWHESTLWVGNHNGNMASYNESGKRLRKFALPIEGWASGMTWVRDELWVVDVWARLWRFNDQFEKIGSFISLSQECGTSSFLQNSPMGLYWDGESLWLADSVSDRIYQCAPSE